MQILELELVTNHLDQQVDFYCRVLGLPVVERVADRVVLQVGTSTLIFRQVDAPLAGYYHFAFTIPANQFAQGKAWLQQRTVLLTDSRGTDEFASAAWNAHSVYFLDPAGNIAELIARHTLANASAEAVSMQSLLCVSEIGIAAADVLAQATTLQAKGGFAVYSGPASPSFTAIGDPQGLFIVVPEGRIWQPETGRAAVHLPIRVVTRTDRESRVWQFPTDS